MNEDYYNSLKLSAISLDLTTKRITSNWIYILTMHIQLLFCTFMRVGGYFESKKNLFNYYEKTLYPAYNGKNW